MPAYVVRCEIMSTVALVVEASDPVEAWQYAQDNGPETCDDWEIEDTEFFLEDQVTDLSTGDTLEIVDDEEEDPSKS